DDGFTSGDVLELRGISPTAVNLRLGPGNDVDVIIAESAPGAADSGQVTVVKGFDNAGIDRIVFDDGTVWNYQDFDALFQRNQATESNDRLVGTSDDDELEGLGGQDLLIGGFGDDTYLYARGDGADTIDDRGDSDGDSLQIAGYADG